jgi:hypothetical protein
MGRKQECGLLVASALGITGKVGLRVWIEYFLACHLISVGFEEDGPASVPMGRFTHPYPCLASLLPIYGHAERCHLYAGIAPSQDANRNQGRGPCKLHHCFSSVATREDL